MTPKIIAIVGATGVQGGSVLNTFLSHTDYQIRALTRSTASSKAQALAAQSSRIQLVAADLSDPSSLATAFKDASVVFGVTDWMSTFQSPELMVNIPANTNPVQHATNIEQQQAQNIFDVAAKIPSLQRMIFSNLPNVTKLSGGKYIKSHHFDSKALAVEYLKTSLPELWEKTSLVQAGSYLENLLGIDIIKPQRIGDEVVFPDYGSSKKKAVYPYLSAAEDIGPVVKALVEIDAGKHVLVAREEINNEQLVELFSKVTGEKARVEYKSGFKADGMPAFMLETFSDTFGFIVEFGYYGNDETIVRPAELGIKLEGSVEGWIRAQDWNKVLDKGN